MRKLVANCRFLLFFALAAACQSNTPSVVRPAWPESLDPEVAALVERLASRAESDPGSGALLDLCLAYEANQLWSEARDCFQDAYNLRPEDSTIGLHLAIVTRETGDPQTALEKLRLLADRYPQSAPVHHRLAEALLEGGALDSAEEAFKRLVELQPQDPRGYAGIGAVHLQREEHQDAIRWLEQALKVQPGFHGGRYLLGTAYRKAGRLEEAEKELARGLGSVPGFVPDPLSSRLEEFRIGASDRLQQAAEELQRGRPAEAAALLEKVVQVQPENTTALNNLAIAYLHLGRLEAAADVLARARVIDPDKFSTYLNLASLARRGGRFDEALQYSEAAISRAPELAQPHYARAQALAELGRFEQALVSAERAATIDSHEARNHTFAGDLCLQLQKNLEALDHYQQALESDSRFLPARLGQVRAAIALGRRSQAREALEKAKRQMPNHPLVRQLEQELASGGR